MGTVLSVPLSTPALIENLGMLFTGGDHSGSATKRGCASSTCLESLLVTPRWIGG